jgi:hypothetical protein
VIRHAIVDLREDEHGPCFTTCDCGVTVRGARPETTAELFAAHRKEAGAPYRVPSDVIRSGPAIFNVPLRQRGF